MESNTWRKQGSNYEGIKNMKVHVGPYIIF